jgi:peptidoglycan glycosyltransferase
LRGDDLPHNLSSYLTRDLLHLPQRGSDIRLTFDLNVQEAIYQAMQGHTGAVVALDVPSGAVLGMISLPTYNPNTLDEDWARLLTATNDPFFNRAIQGEYQPGGVMQTPLITAAFIANEPLDSVIEGAAEIVELDGIEIACAERPPSNRLTFSEAYAFACPAPFADLFNRLGEETVQETVDLFQLGRNFTLPGFVVEPDPAAVTPTAILQLHTPLETALGQGALTVSPLDIAVMTAAVINDGNAPQPYALTATRAPDSEIWTPIQTVLPTIPVTTAETSRRIQELMRSATIIGSARPAARSGMTIGGHASLAYSGDGTQAWFIGFVITGQRQGVVVAVVLENTDRATDAAAIGGQILQTAYEQATTTATTP